MADFHQNGNIAQFHNLRTRPVEELEYELEGFASNRKITLILPCLYSELHRPALGEILDVLSGARYVGRVIIGLDRANEAEFRMARGFFTRLPQETVVIWNDSPRLQAFQQRLEDLGLAPQEAGKGKNVWISIGYLLACADTSVMAIHDCDIVTYNRGILASLVYPVANPNFSYQLSKGFYARVGGGKLNGRVMRLLISPLLIALKKVVGDHDYIDYLRSFRYPLSGEVAMRTATLPDLRIPSDWGLEIGVLSEAWRNLGRNAVCQVEVADCYDHKHQKVSAEDANSGLNRMSTDICKAIFRKLATEGIVFTPNVFRTLKATYYRHALDLLEIYADDATMNGLSLDRHQEEETIELFADNIVRAGTVFLESPQELPFIPNWSRINAADATLIADLMASVKEDATEFEERPFVRTGS